jgi:hypothetical protein
LHEIPLEIVQILHNYCRAMSTRLQPAARVIDLCGGIDATAGIVGRDRSVVNRWLLPRERGGTGGRIPMHHAQRLLESVPVLREEDFFCRREPAAINAAQSAKS